MAILPERALQPLTPFRSNASLAPLLYDSQIPLYEWLTYDEIEEIRIIFKNAPEQKFNYKKYRQLLMKFRIHMSNDDYDDLFNRTNTTRDSYINWKEFISYLILGFQQDDPDNQKEKLLNPISMAPEVRRSGHEHRIACIKRIYIVLTDKSIKSNTGGYITVSKDGTINFWTEDLEIKRSEMSKNPYLEISKTMIVSIAALPDVRIICTSSTESDLRFYDTTPTTFFLRIIISSLPWPVNCMNYYYSKSNDQSCKLVMGDFGGNVRVIEFNSELRGPFQNILRNALIEISWDDLMEGRHPQMKAREFLDIHNDVVRQIYFSESLNSVFSAAECHAEANSVTECPAMAAIDLSLQNSVYKFYTSKGISTFSLDEDNNLIATGGPDCLVRLWNALAPQKPVCILSGHDAGIVYVFIQPGECKVYSVDYNKIIKVWDVNEHTLLQTYFGLQDVIPQCARFVCYYNDENHELLIGTRKIISLKCCPLIRLDLTDGDTHAGPVSVVLYNTLFKSVVTCGLDSFIIVWDPWTGKRVTLIKNAHERVLIGKNLKIEITAACFDPMQHFLVTGARDGTLKVWDFNSGVCMRNLSVEGMCEVTTVIWIKSRIFAIGWNRHVTEFSDVEGQEWNDGKNWETLHDEDVLCATVKEPEALATGCYSGIIILWKLKTGEPYRKYNVANPTQFIILEDERRRRNSQKNQKIGKKQAGKTKFYLEKRKRKTLNEDVISGTLGECAPELTTRSRSIKNFNSLFSTLLEMPTRSAIMRPLSIRSMLFLKTRPYSKEHGTLLVALENGIVQIYSHHNVGGFMNQFSAIHMPGDCIVAMTTDEQNRYLFTATAFGYIKTWLMTNFCIPEREHKSISMPRLRLQFPFLSRDRFEGRAKRSARGQLFPMLLNSYKAHLRPISSLQYINREHILISGSADKTTRLWTLGGRYLGTLGTPLPWLKLLPSNPVVETANYRIPPDIAKVASSTTFKVLTGAEVERVSKLESTTNDTDELASVAGESEIKSMYGNELSEPILGKHFKLPVRARPHTKPTLDKSLPYIPVYTHLEIHKATPIERPPTPEALKRTRELDFVQQ